MPNMWTTLSQGRDGVMARGVDVVRRTRETSADLLGRAEQRATALQERLATRRGGLNGNPIEKVERRVLAGIESILGRMGLGLRIQIRRLASFAPEPVQVALDAGPERALSSSTAPVAARAPRKRMRIEVQDVPVAEATEATGSAPPAKAKARARAKQKSPKARPAARSTRWVSPAAPSVEELAKLPVKTLLAKVDDLGDSQRRALLAHERATKARKTVIAALSAKLPS